MFFVTFVNDDQKTLFLCFETKLRREVCSGTILRQFRDGGRKKSYKVIFLFSDAKYRRSDEPVPMTSNTVTAKQLTDQITEQAGVTKPPSVSKPCSSAYPALYKTKPCSVDKGGKPAQKKHSR